MAATSRELVYQTLDRQDPARAPRQLWALPWANLHYPRELQDLHRDFPADIGGVDGHLAAPSPLQQGDPYTVGRSTDAWGCVFENIQAGVHGEVKDPIVKDWATDGEHVRFPDEWLTVNVDAVNRDCDASSAFLLAGACPRPFEQLQFLRGSQELFLDLADPSPAFLHFLARLRTFYNRLLEVWAKTHVDSLMFMDDWGTQHALLIHPRTWRELFKPFYRDFAGIAHGAGKRIFMHTDGHTLSIYPDLVELGVDAVNSQLFCMGVENLRPFAGHITFWGEMDRQHLLCSDTPEDVRRGVRLVYDNLWRHGGCMAQCEFGAGTRPANVRAMFEEWDRLTARPA